jgi:hypothetical protein
MCKVADHGRRPEGRGDWAIARRDMERAAQTVGGGGAAPEIGWVKKVGDGLSRDVFAAEVGSRSGAGESGASGRRSSRGRMRPGPGTWTTACGARRHCWDRRGDLRDEHPRLDRRHAARAQVNLASAGRKRVARLGAGARHPPGGGGALGARSRSRRAEKPPGRTTAEATRPAGGDAVPRDLPAPGAMQTHRRRPGHRAKRNREADQRAASAATCSISTSARRGTGAPVQAGGLPHLRP